MRIVNIGNTGLAANPLKPSMPPPGGGGTTERVALLVNTAGTLYPVGPALSLGDSGKTVIVAAAVNATVYGETLVIQNPGS